MTKQNLYKSDIALWSKDMARLLRERRFDEVDCGERSRGDRIVRTQRQAAT